MRTPREASELLHQDIVRRNRRFVRVDKKEPDALRELHDERNFGFQIESRVDGTAAPNYHLVNVLNTDIDRVRLCE